MHAKNTCILVALAAGLFAFIYFYERHLTDPPPTPTKVLTDFKAAEVTSIQILPSEIRATFTNGTWQLIEPLAYPARSKSIEALLHALEGLSYQLRFTPQELKENSKSGSDYGMDAPSLTVLMQAGSDLPRVLKFGNHTPPGDQIYVQLVAREDVDVVSTDVLKLIPRQVNEWRDTTFADLKAAPFDHLVVTNGDKILELQRDPAALWRMVQPMKARADNLKVDSLLAALQNLQVNRFETDDSKADFDSFGLQPPRWHLTIGEGTNTLTTFQFGKSPTNDDTEIYARVAGQNTVVQVPRGPIDAWCDDYEKFRDRRLAGLVSGALDMIEVVGPESFALARATNDLWLVEASKSQVLAADTKLMRQFIEDIAKLTVVPINGQFAKDAVREHDPELAKYGLAAPARKYILKRAVSTNLTVVAELQFGAEKDGIVFARRPDETSVYAVDAAEFHKLPTRSLDLLERRLWTFTENDVARMVTQVGGKTQKLAHSGTNKWVLEAGQVGIINPFEIEAAVSEFGSLQAARWVACTNQTCAQYGFTDKSPKVSAELFGGTMYSLELGGWSPEKHRYGSVQSGTNYLVFEISDDQRQRIFPALRIPESGP
jgi:hypothetical protein